MGFERDAEGKGFWKNDKKTAVQIKVAKDEAKRVAAEAKAKEKADAKEEAEAKKALEAEAKVAEEEAKVAEEEKK